MCLEFPLAILQKTRIKKAHFYITLDLGNVKSVSPIHNIGETDSSTNTERSRDSLRISIDEYNSVKIFCCRG